ncbi:unnamed protein product, partial [Ectocarpus sp. 4 AP-2014]
MGDVIVPLRRLGNDTILCSVSLELDNPSDLTPSSRAGDDDFGYPSGTPGNRVEEDEFGYDNNDDLLGDVMDHTSYLDLESPTSHLSVIPSSSDTSDMQQLVNNIQEVTSQDL